MRVAIIAGLSLIVVVLLVNSFRNYNPLFESIHTSSLELELNSLTTDKQVYYSNEMMNITLDVYASEDAEATVKVFGIKDRRNNHRLNKQEVRNLTSGSNIISYSYRTPSCYGCAGISSGIKQITALVSCDNTTTNSTIEIEIKR